MTKMTMVQALNLALKQEMEKDDSVILLGEDVGRDGGVFRVTEGLMDQFGEQRVVDTPLAESAIVGMSIGMAAYGLKPVCEIQFSGFSYQNFHQIENHAARLRQRSQGRYPMSLVLRAPYGGGVRALEHHSESREAYWAHTPGLKMVIPSGPRNARALMVSAIRDPDPVIFFEHKNLLGNKCEVPDGEYVLPLGQAAVLREGKDATIIALAAMVPRALKAAETLAAEHGISATVIDLRCLVPLDTRTILEHSARTGRVFTVEENPRLCGWGAEVVSIIQEEAFSSLKGPMVRITTPHIPLPAADRLEDEVIPSVARIIIDVR